MQFKANCKRDAKDTIEVACRHEGTVFIKITELNDQSAIVLSKEDALALASTIINHYKVEQK